MHDWITNFMLHQYIVVSAAIIYDQGKGFLLQQRSFDKDFLPGVWAITGGKLEQTEAGGDVLENNVIREVEEEIGVTVGELEYVDSHMAVHDDVWRVFVIFSAKIISGVPHVMDPSEVAQVRWVRHDGLDQYELPAAVRRAIDKASLRLGWGQK